VLNNNAAVHNNGRHSFTYGAQRNISMRVVYGLVRRAAWAAPVMNKKFKKSKEHITAMIDYKKCMGTCFQNFFRLLSTLN
jgi:hypothetical protein